MPGFAFSYDNDREILSGVNMTFKRGAFTAIVGESGVESLRFLPFLQGEIKGMADRFRSEKQNCLKSVKPTLWRT